MSKDVIMQIVTVIGGLALFLYGMKLMSNSLEAAAGAKFKNILNWVTKNRIVGVATGALITAVIQSSSATTVMVVGLVNSGLLKLAQAVSVVMGANIGTTITGLIIALKVNDIAPIAIALGVFIIMGSKRDKTRHTGQIIAGLGILFLGMNTMSGVLKPLAGTEAASNLLASIENPLIGILIGLAMTAIVQSSSATTGTVIMLGGTGLLPLHIGLFIIFGAEIGTCVTSLLASIGASKSARQVSIVHFSFNIVGTLLFSAITLIPPGALSEKPYLLFLESLIMNDVGKQLAIAHIIFNASTALLLLPFIKYLVKWANFIIPLKDEELSSKRLIYVNEQIFSMPHIAVEQTRKEVERMANLALENYKLSVDMFLERNIKNTEKIKKNEELINFLNHELTKYLVKINTLKLESNDRKLIGSFFHIVNDIERIGDHAENIMEFSMPFIEEKKMFSEDAVDELRKLTAEVEKVIESSIKYFIAQTYDPGEIDRINDLEDKVDDAVEQFKNNHIDRLNDGICTPTSGMLFVNMLSDLERVSDHACNIVTSLHVKKLQSSST
ncbi:MAG: Na/Pi cotransporter family protein [Oscillospiraceae bacterium]|nr:Na/Pi cotransporter family protein [Oscillospiraceae bacterium]